MSASSTSTVGQMHRVPAVAEMLDVCTETVYRLVARGDLKATRVGRVIRVSDEQIAAYLAQAQG